MGSVNKTANYGLNQWQGNEYPKREDYVDDNKKIDDALKSNADAIVNHKSDSSVHITQLTCTTSGTVHALTGLTATAGIASCVFKADANYAAGNTFTVGGTAYPVVTSGGEALRAGVFLSGDIVGIKLDIDNKKLYIRQDSATQVGLGNVDNTHDADKSVKYSATAGSALANGGTASYAHYPSHAVGLADWGLRGNFISSVSPSGGNDGDTWDQV